MPVYRSGNEFSDRPANLQNGEPIVEIIKALTNTKRRRVTGRELSPAEAREAIAAQRGVAYRLKEENGGDSAGGIDSPLTEQYYEGILWYGVVSSDGLFVFEFPASTTYIDNSHREVVVVHLDPDLPPPP